MRARSSINSPATVSARAPASGELQPVAGRNRQFSVVDEFADGVEDEHENDQASAAPDDRRSLQKGADRDPPETAEQEEVSPLGDARIDAQERVVLRC